MELKTTFSIEEILRLLPHRPPFLFVDRVTRLERFSSDCGGTNAA